MDDLFSVDDTFKIPASSSSELATYNNFDLNDPAFEAEIAELTGTRNSCVNASNVINQLNKSSSSIIQDENDPISSTDTNSQMDSISNEENIEIELLKKFNDERERKIRIKEEEQKKMETITLEKAKKELTTFYEERKKKLSIKKDNNRKEEIIKKEKLINDLSNKNPWERVFNLVDVSENANSARKKQEKLRSASSKEISTSSNTTSKIASQIMDLDVSRMKQLLIQLKHEPVDRPRSQNHVP